MSISNVYLEAIKEIPLEIQKEAALSFAISDKIHSLIVSHGMTQKELARKMGKTESEISVWLSGQHNFTLRTLAKISAVLGEDVIQVSI